MLKERVYTYYIDRDYNCAEATLRAANDEFGLNLSEDALKVVGGFGGGLGCESTCGALCSAMEVISRCAIKGRAHATEGFKELCANYVKRFEERLGGSCCSDVKKCYYAGDTRCLKAVEAAADVLEEYYNEKLK